MTTLHLSAEAAPSSSEPVTTTLETRQLVGFALPGEEPFYPIEQIEAFTPGYPTTHWRIKLSKICKERPKLFGEDLLREVGEQVTLSAKGMATLIALSSLRGMRADFYVALLKL